MRKVLVLLLLLSLQAYAQDFTRVADKFVDEWLALNPETATSLGDHRYDGKLSDYSPEGIARARELSNRYLKALRAIDPGKLSPENQVDYEIMKSNLEYTLFQLDQVQEQNWNPLLYNPGSALYALMARDYAPLPERVQSLAQRLDAVEPLLSQARQNLKNPPKIHTETAISQNQGALSFVDEEIDTFLKDRPDLVQELAPHRQKASAALKAYGEWLKKDLLPRSNGDFRLGDKLFREKLRFALESDLTKEQILQKAQEELAATQQEMTRTAGPLFERYFPGEPRPASDKILIKRVLDRLAQDRPTNETIVQQASRDLDATTAWVRDHKLSPFQRIRSKSW